MESPKKYGPYNQYIPHKDVVYSLIGYHVYLEDQATYPSFGTHKIEESLHHTLDDAKKRMTELINNKRHPVYKWHRFLIYEVPLGIHYSSGWDGQRCWTYDRKGEFVAESKVQFEAMYGAAEEETDSTEAADETVDETAETTEEINLSLFFLFLCTSLL